MASVQTVFGPNGEQRLPCLFPVTNMTTYELRQPLETHFKVVDCKEAECPKFHSGWQMGYDLTDPLKVEAANLLASVARKRHMVFSHQVLGTVVTFTFQPGQNCFETHRIYLEREPFAIRRSGDWRGNPRGREEYVHKDVIDWRDDFAEHQDKIAQNLGVD